MGRPSIRSRHPMYALTFTNPSCTREYTSDFTHQPTLKAYVVYERPRSRQNWSEIRRTSFRRRSERQQTARLLADSHIQYFCHQKQLCIQDTTNMCNNYYIPSNKIFYKNITGYNDIQSFTLGILLRKKSPQNQEAKFFDD